MWIPTPLKKKIWWLGIKAKNLARLGLYRNNSHSFYNLPVSGVLGYNNKDLCNNRMACIFNFGRHSHDGFIKA